MNVNTHQGDMLILPFDQISKNDLPQVGGKGANLGEMASHGFPIPGGFCLTTAAYSIFMKASGLEDEIYAALAGLDSGGVMEIGAAAEKIRRQICSAAIPEPIIKALTKELNRYDDATAFAVRSSATAEDLPDASFAGQQDTYLNVRGFENILNQTRSCWASLFTDRAVAYRIENEFDHKDVKLSVVIQEMVFPEIAGIMFTADPISQSRDIISIDASYGLGEALVSGLVSADLYRFDKQELCIIEKTIGDKKIAILPTDAGGTVQIALSAEKQASQALPDILINKLCEIGMDVENHYQSPQDIEWCVAGGKIFVVQSRPITTLYPLVRPAHKGDSPHLYISFNHVQVMTDPMKPLGGSIFQMMFPFGEKDPQTGQSSVMVEAGGRLYVDITDPVTSMRPARKLFQSILPIIDELMAQAVTEALTRPEFQPRFNLITKRAILKRFFTFFLPLFTKLFANIVFRKPEPLFDQINTFIDKYYASIERRVKKAGSNQTTVKEMESVLQELLLTLFSNLLPKLVAGMVSSKILNTMTADKGLDDELTDLTRGMEGNVVSKMNLAVGDLADIASESPEVIAVLKEDSIDLKSLKNVEGGDAFLKALDAFIDDYGFRGQSEIDITSSRWFEDPSFLLKVILGNVEGKVKGDHRTRHKAMREKADQSAAVIVERLQQERGGRIKAKIADKLIRNYRSLFAGREHPKYCMIKVLGLVKKELLGIWEGLVSSGVIENVEDLYFLTFSEIHKLVQSENPDDLPAVINTRKGEYRRYQKMASPKVLLSTGEIITSRHRTDNLPEGAIPGSPVSGGIIEGAARVVLDPQKEVLQKGEILIAPFTDPAWTPLFINAAGLIMEVGGLMTHGSVIAREYGVPAVVNIPDATKRIKTGQIVRVNGDQGYIEILD